ncbi:unknown [Prevotella sp. CAG:1124]|nr:unknown [Prevotella sp. CAG:1124]
MLTNITRTNGKRHDTCELRLVARGTPKRLATVMPAIIIDTAPVL